jgi:quercetin dioxygenase-like cupin family protein
MQIFRGDAAQFALADANSFTGPARTKRLASDDIGMPVLVYHVEFETGGRTNWHTHTGPQWLFVVGGRVRVQKWGDAAREVTVGDAVVIHPGEKHWHGAAPGGTGAHIAVNVNATTQWLEPVSEEDYKNAVGVGG